jgi:methionyl-tRNA synthetase
MTKKRILVTAALPYANGPIHLGHLVEYIQTDIWVRFQKLRGRQCIYICADDTHGTAIMIRARQEGRSEEDLIAEMKAEHESDFARFDIQFDNYGSTHSPENRQLCQRIWSAIRRAGLVKEKEVAQLYDVQAGTFLADRFVRGTCPNPACRAQNQPGDNCSVCGSTYSPSELENPISTLTGTTPVVRSAIHLFIELDKLHGFLDEWTQTPGHLPPETAKYLKGNFLGHSNQPGGKKELRDWDISRPAPYFGFEIPDSPGNYWYVWFDAPIGYMASTQQWCDRHGQDLDDWWRSDDTEIHHFIGKDIAYFHALFWPGMLKTAGYSLPTKIHIHGFLTVGGEKMSKSQGTFVRAATYLNYLEPGYLRYYYASKLGPRVEDLDLSLDEFTAKVDSDLVNKVVNLASRTARFVEPIGLSATYPDDGGLFQQAAMAGESIAQAYEEGDYNRAMRLIMELADRANPYVESQEPWKLNKVAGKRNELQNVCTVALNLFRQIVVYLTPVLPGLARQTAELLNDPIHTWDQSQTPLTGTKVSPFRHMMQRVDPKKVAAMIEDSKESEPSSSPVPPTDDDQPLRDEPIASEITIDEFAKVDLRVARVVTAEQVPEADKLLKLTLSLGGNTTRTVLAGIKQAYEPSQLVGRLVIVVANLAPRKMKFGLSEGMVTAAGPGGREVFLLSVDEGAKPGQRVH